MELCKPSICTGCMACANICPKGAIEITQDDEGFYSPFIISDKCVECGKCNRICPQINKIKTTGYKKRVYAGWIKNKTLRKASTSGGAFTAFSKSILNQNGIVFGAGYDKKMRVVHKSVTKYSELSELRGSKYVQSMIGSSYKDVKEALNKGRKVLFVGTACQVAGLYAYLGDRYASNLFTIDLVCHGVPSPKVFESYLHFMQEKYHSEVVNVFFRNKNPGWYLYGVKVEFSNSKVYENHSYRDPYSRGFLRDCFLRPSCYSCNYANCNRIADITLADFWGYQSTIHNLRVE